MSECCLEIGDSDTPAIPGITMPIDTEDSLKMKLDEIRSTCDAIEDQVQLAGGSLSYLDKSKCMSQAMQLKHMALEVHNYFAYLDE